MKNIIYILFVVVSLFSTQAFAVTTVFKTVKKSGGDFSTISKAFSAIPRNLIRANQKWIIEIADSEIYREKLILNKKTSAQNTITIQAKAGEKPLLMPSTWRDGIRVYYTQHVTIDGLSFAGMRRGHGVYLWGSSHAVVKNCHIYNSNYPGITVYGTKHAVIENNRIENTVIGIMVYWYNHSNIFKNNIITKSILGGMRFLLNAHHNTVINNTFYDNGNELEFVRNPGYGNRFINNIFSHQKPTAAFRFDRNIPNDTFFDYNDVYVPSGEVARVGPQSYVTLSDWQAASGIDEHSHCADPLFASTEPGYEDFHLESSAVDGRFNALTQSFDQTDLLLSPAVDAGDPQSVFLNEPQDNGSLINQGAYGNTDQASKSDAGAKAHAQCQLSYAQNISLSQIDASYIGEDLGDQLGTAVSGVGDVDGDGFDDFLVGANEHNKRFGKVYLFYGSKDRLDQKHEDITLSDASFVGEFSHDDLGGTVTPAGDVDQDGYDDFMIAALQNNQTDFLSGKVYFIFGGPRSKFSKNMPITSVADASFVGEVHHAQLGYQMESADINNDGFSDVFIQTRNFLGGTGKIYLIFGGPRSKFSKNTPIWTFADASFEGDETQFGLAHMDAGGDLDNDGISDMVFTATGVNAIGKVYIYFGGPKSKFSPNMKVSQTSDASLVGTTFNDFFAGDVALDGDINDDGYADLVIGMSGDGNDVVYILFGGKRSKFKKNVDITKAYDASFVGEGVGAGLPSRIGDVVTTSGDLNNDGIADLLLHEFAYQKVYAILGHRGTWEKNKSISEHDASFVSETGQAYYPFRVEFLGDIDGDGADEVGIGDHSYNDQPRSTYQWSIQNRGKVYIIYPLDQ